MKWIFNNWFSFKGTIGRKDFIIKMVVIHISYYLVILCLNQYLQTRYIALNMLNFFWLVWITALIDRRMRDINSKYYVLPTLLFFTCQIFHDLPILADKIRDDEILYLCISVQGLLIFIYACIKKGETNKSEA